VLVAGELPIVPYRKHLLYRKKLHTIYRRKARVF
jgi:hypothetical protein